MYEKKDEKKATQSGGYTSLSALGEFGLIDRITAGIKHYHPDTIKGVGDDAAVIDKGNKLMLISTDLLVEEFILTWPIHR